MPELDIDYSVNDRASSSVERITGKLKELKSGYRDIRRSVGDLKKGMSVANAVGLGAFTSAFSASNGSGSAQQANKIKSIVKTVSSPAGEAIGQVARVSSMIAGGALAGTLMESGIGRVAAMGVTPRVSNAITTSLGSRAATFATSIGSNVLTQLPSALRNNVTNRVASTATNRVASGVASTVAGASMPGFSMTGGKFGAIGRFAGSLGAGLASFGIATAAQLAVENFVLPEVDRIFNKTEFNDEYVKGMSLNYLSDKSRMDQDIFNLATTQSKEKGLLRRSIDVMFGTQGTMDMPKMRRDKDGKLVPVEEREDISGTSYLMREMFGTNKKSIEGMKAQIGFERSERTAEIKDALYLMIRN
jgi:hypothetical protein